MFVIVNEKGLFWSSSLYGEYGEGWSTGTADIMTREEAEKVLDVAVESFEPGKIWVKEIGFK